MKEKHGEQLNVRIFTLYSEEAEPYAHEFRGSTNVRLDNGWVPLDVAVDGRKMEDFLSQRL